MSKPQNKKIAIIGLGYVGLPLAIEFAAYFPVIGFDINKERVAELNSGKDRTQEADIEKLNKALQDAKANDFAVGLLCSNDVEVLKTANVFIVTVPTPIDKYNAPTSHLY